MALRKTTTIKGYDAEYWRILQANYNVDRPEVTVSLALYRDKATREADPMAVMLQYTFDLANALLGSSVAIPQPTLYRDVALHATYQALKALAAIEAAKPGNDVEHPGSGSGRDELLAWFADAEIEYHSFCRI